MTNDIPFEKLQELMRDSILDILKRPSEAIAIALVFAVTEDAIQLGIGKDIAAKISERADKSYSTQVYYCMSLGAVRMEEKKVVQIPCHEA